MQGQKRGANAGREVPILWRGRRVRAFVPVPLAQRVLSLGTETVAATATAIADISNSAADLPLDVEPLARLLRRAEGIASSYIEGVGASVADIAIAERADLHDHSSAAQVVSSFAAARAAVDGVQVTDSLRLTDLLTWHRALMMDSPLPSRYVGVLREEQGWIGGTSPLDAHLVTPPPERVPELMSDLLTYVNATRGNANDPVAQAAIAHAQFEIIHPFADGNGRIGRLLVSWILTRRLSLVSAPPVSVCLARDVGAYTSGLTHFRMGDHERWIRWFASVVSAAARTQTRLVDEVARVQTHWRALLAEPGPAGRRLPSHASAWRVLDLMPGQIVLTSASVAAALNQSVKASNSALQTLVAMGVLVQHGVLPVDERGRPARAYVSPQLLGLVGSSPLGDSVR